MYVFKRRKLRLLSTTLPTPASSHPKAKSQKVTLKSETLEPAHRLQVQFVYTWLAENRRLASYTMTFSETVDL